MNASYATRTLLTAFILFGTTNAYAKNVLIIIGDDIAVDKVSSYAGDYPTYSPTYRPNTPAIDGIGAAGLRFTRAWATPLCSPTRVSFQTGKHPFRTGIGTALGSNAVGVDPTAHLMLAESFQTRGYVTGMFGKWHMGTEDENGAVGYPSSSPFFDVPHPVRSGWKRFYGIYDGYPGFGRSFTDWPRVGWVTGAGPGTGYAADEFLHHTERTTTVASSWISKQTDPWMAVVAYSAPHSPDTGSASWTYGDEAGASWRSASLNCLNSQSCGDEARSVYQALAEHVDLEIERLLNSIGSTVMDDTIIIFFGDNGTPRAVQEDDFDAAGRGKGFTYENGLRVPFVVADGVTWRTGGAGIIDMPGRDVDIAVNSTDLYQTLHLELLNIGVLGTDSTSFGVCFNNTDPFCGFTERRYGYSETYSVSGSSISSARVGVRYGHDKMVAVYNAQDTCMDAEFYTTDTDPFELTPLVWPGVRGDRLRDHFTNLHASEPNSWANLGGTTIGFCQ